MVLATVKFEASSGTEEQFGTLSDIYDVLTTYPEIFQHSLRVAELMSIFLPRLPMTQNNDEAFLEQVSIATVFHDVGKLSVPDRVLYKAGSLSDTEFMMIKYHTVCGAKLLSTRISEIANPLVDSAVYLAETHHENWNGTGYPKSLYHNDIAIISQLSAILDSYDAIRSFRVYKSQRDHKSACNSLWASSGIRYNPQLLAEVLELEDFLKIPYD